MRIAALALWKSRRGFNKQTITILKAWELLEEDLKVDYIIAALENVLQREPLREGMVLRPLSRSQNIVQVPQPLPGIISVLPSPTGCTPVNFWGLFPGDIYHFGHKKEP